MSTKIHPEENRPNFFQLVRKVIDESNADVSYEEILHAIASSQKLLFDSPEELIQTAETIGLKLVTDHDYIQVNQHNLIPAKPFTRRSRRQRIANLPLELVRRP